MGQRNRQHMGRSTDDDRDLVGRDLRDGDAIAEEAEHTDIPRPNEEGTNFRPDQPLDRVPGRDAADRGADRGRGDDAERAGGGGSAPRDDDVRR